MPKPLRPGTNIYVERKCRPGSYAMPSMEASLDHYSIAFNVSGDRKWFSYDRVDIMHAGDVGLGMIHVYHRNLPMSDLPYDRYLIKYRKEALQPLIDLIGEREFERMYRNHTCRFTREMQEKLREQFQEMLEEFERDSPYTQLLLKGMLQKLFLAIYENYIPEADTDAIFPPSYDERIYNAIIYMEEHLGENLSLTKTASHAALSAPYFCKLFKDVMGCSFSDYLNQIRLQHAAILLGQTDLSVTEVAEKAGFSNGNYFCNVFRRQYQMSPTAFRKSTRE